MSRRAKKRREGLHLTDKKHPKQGIWATVLGIVSILLFLTVCIMSGQAKGQMGIEAGFLGLLCILISIFGFVLAWLGLRVENIRQLFPSLGIIINGLMILLYLLVYVVGSSI